MTPFEKDLMKSLAPVDPPSGFTERVLARLPARRRQRNSSLTWRAAAAAAVTVLLAGGAIYQQHQRDLRGELAKEKLLFALRIAGTKLQSAQRSVQQVESGEVDQ